MRKLILTLTFITLLSCKSNFQEDNYLGFFSNHRRGFKCNLELKKEGEFKLELKDSGFTKSCIGNWKFISKDSIQLTCSEENTTRALSLSYLNNRVQKIKVISKSKVKLNNTVLKRTKKGNIPN